MSIKDDVRSVVAELSPILAGFKLAVIVIGYFGFGSVAKWLISYWYPFTRWIWDQVAVFLAVPEFPIMVKDSLTALIFFLPLGLSAILQRVKGVDPGSAQHRFLGGVFGFLFLFIICKDVIGTIFSAIALSYQAVGISSSEETGWYTFLIVLFVYVFFGVVGFKLIKVIRSHPVNGSSLLSKIHNFLSTVKKFHNKNRFIFLLINIALVSSSFLHICFEMLSRAKSEDASAVLSAMSILVFIVVSLLVAIFYAPKKLYITTGAAIAFLLAAFGFEAFIVAKTFMENVQS